MLPHGGSVSAHVPWLALYSCPSLLTLMALRRRGLMEVHSYYSKDDEAAKLGGAPPTVTLAQGMMMLRLTTAFKLTHCSFFVDCQRHCSCSCERK